MTSRRQSKRESVIKKSLKLQEKLKERAKKKGVANPESGPSVDKAPAVEDNSNLTSNVNIDPTLLILIAQNRVVTKKFI